MSKFSVATGRFIAHVISNGISYPNDVVQCEDGSMVVAHYKKGVACVGKDGVTVQNITISSRVPWPTLSYSPSLNGVVVKCRDGGGVFVLRDMWSHSLRSAWVCMRACLSKINIIQTPKKMSGEQNQNLGFWSMRSPFDFSAL